MPTSESVQKASGEWFPGRNGGMLKRGGPGRPKAREQVVETLREALFVKGDEKGIIPALVAKAIKGDLKAIELCLAYGIGKPTDRVELSGPDGAPITTATESIPDHERRALQDAIEREIAARHPVDGEAAGAEGKPRVGAGVAPDPT